MKAAHPSYRLELMLLMDDVPTRYGFASFDAPCWGDWVFHVASLLRCLVVGSEHHQCMHGCSAPRVPVEPEGSPSVRFGGLDGRGSEALCFIYGPADHQSNHLDEKSNRNRRPADCNGEDHSSNGAASRDEEELVGTDAATAPLISRQSRRANVAQSTAVESRFVQRREIASQLFGLLCR